jgi:hypothetical protein
VHGIGRAGGGRHTRDELRLQGEVERVLRTVSGERGGGELPGLQVAPVLTIVHLPVPF